MRELHSRALRGTCGAYIWIGRKSNPTFTNVKKRERFDSVNESVLPWSFHANLSDMMHTRLQQVAENDRSENRKGSQSIGPFPHFSERPKQRQWMLPPKPTPSALCC